VSQHEVVRLRGGALAIRSCEASEVMHPGVGPLVEARELYVRQSRLAERLRQGTGPLVLFDVGLGAGSNALAARAQSEAAPPEARPLELVSFERDLEPLALALTHGADFAIEGESARAARALLDGGRCDTARTCWRLQHGDALEALAREPSRADIIFWDPFSAKANPTLWTVAAFAAARRAAGPRCTLFTYSASTAVRVALLLAGWTVGAGDPIGLRARTTAAAVDVADLAQPLDRAWLARLSLADVPLPSDAPADAVQRVATFPQFGG
jgi:queuine tRNA-ribosyltransferase